MFRPQMTETSNPKHGCVVQMHASVLCQPVGMLTDDAPDSSSLRCSPPPPPPVTFRLRQTPACLPLYRTCGEITEAHSQIIHRAPLLNM